MKLETILKRAFLPFSLAAAIACGPGQTSNPDGSDTPPDAGCQTTKADCSSNPDAGTPDSGDPDAGNQQCTTTPSIQYILTGPTSTGADTYKCKVNDPVTLDLCQSTSYSRAVVDFGDGQGTQAVTAQNCTSLHQTYTTPSQVTIQAILYNDACKTQAQKDITLTLEPAQDCTPIAKACKDSERDAQGNCLEYKVGLNQYFNLDIGQAGTGSTSQCGRTIAEYGIDWFSNGNYQTITNTDHSTTDVAAFTIKCRTPKTSQLTVRITDSEGAISTEKAEWECLSQ